MRHVLTNQTALFRRSVVMLKLIYDIGHLSTLVDGDERQDQPMANQLEN